MLWSLEMHWMKVERWLIPVMCICEGAPIGFGATGLWKLIRLGNMKTGFNLGAHTFQSDYAIVTGLAPKWSPFHVLCDDFHIVGNTPYRFGAIKLWSRLWLCYVQPLSPTDSGTERLHILHTASHYQFLHCSTRPNRIIRMCSLASLLIFMAIE